ncbi:unnamed protein product [Gongylonema pulchrum]|uniref:non-specific serine/threonine protein kinase n=1 Tax=Gongylonema pulchrum TaxID=637853 RepID=A0A183DYJ9_9BILA|nr:unnamed protein product [Gongylonema pulchrum]
MTVSDLLCIRLWRRMGRSGSSPEASPLDARKGSGRGASVSATSGGQRCGVMPDLLPKTPIERSAPFLAFTKDGSSASIESQSVEEYPSGVNSLPKSQAQLALRDREKSFVAYFGAGMGGAGTVNRPGRSQDTNQVQVNVNPTPVAASNVYQLITRRRFEQMAVLEGQNILVTISGRKRRIRVYYLSWLKQKILRTEGVSGVELEKRNGWVNVGDLQGAVHFKIVRYERIKFLVVGLEGTIEIYAWAPKPYHKFMAFKAFSQLAHLPLIVDLTVEENARLKVIYGSREGFHAIDLDSGSIDDIYTPANTETAVCPHCIVILPNSNGMQLLLCYNNEGVYVSTYGKATKNVFLQWGETPSSVGKFFGLVFANSNHFLFVVVLVCVVSSSQLYHPFGLPICVHSVCFFIVFLLFLGKTLNIFGLFMRFLQLCNAKTHIVEGLSVCVCICVYVYL